MDLTVLDTEFTPVAIVDVYESFIWTDRYREWGDFELYTPMTNDILNYIKQDYYLVNRNSEYAMIIEKLLINSNNDTGNHLTVTGRSLESILDRRIVWKQTRIRGNLQNGIKKLIYDNIISPTDANRKIENFIFEESIDPRVTELTIDAQFTGDNLYEVIRSICAERNLGFKVTLNDDNIFVFKLYVGVDRSYEQTDNPYVVFSPNFDNLINSNYIESKSSLKNVTLIGGEGEGSERKFATLGNSSGLNRREIFTDARDITSTVDEVTLSNDEYTAQLQQRGSEKLAENVEVVSFEGEAETTLMFKYGEDFFIGDVVQVANEYGHETKAQIIEVVISENEEGSSIYPTFETIQEGA